MIRHTSTSFFTARTIFNVYSTIIYNSVVQPARHMCRMAVLMWRMGIFLKTDVYIVFDKLISISSGILLNYCLNLLKKAMP